MFGQEPLGQQPAPEQAMTLMQQLELLGWVDRTAIAVLVAFFVIGLFKGLIWQTSRIAILVVAYVVAGRFGETVGDMIARKHAAPPVPPEPGAVVPPVETPETTLYLAYLILFVGVLVILSLVAMIVQKLATKAGLGFFDRVGGGVLGIATGACVVLFGLFVVGMFFKGSALAQAAETSHSRRLSRLGIDWLGTKVPDDLRDVLALAPLDVPNPNEGPIYREFDLPPASSVGPTNGSHSSGAGSNGTSSPGTSSKGQTPSGTPPPAGAVTEPGKTRR